MNEKLLISNLVVILSTSCAVVLLFQRLKLAVIPAYLIAGMLVGPTGFGLITSDNILNEIGHLAIVLLLFGIGMELHVSSLKRNALLLIGSALTSCTLTVLLAFLLLQAIGIETAPALVIALGFSLSSTALVLRILDNRRELTRGHGQLALAILVIQDLLVLVMLALLPTIAAFSAPVTAGSSELSSSIVIDRLLTALGLLAIFIAGQKLLPRLLKESLRSRSNEVLMLCAVTAALLAGYATAKLGFSLEMGAFLVGFLLASSNFRYQLSGQVAPLRDLFLAVFFTSLGMEVNLNILFANLSMILLGTLFLIAIKALCIGFAVWVFGIHQRIAIVCAVILAQAGEFSLIIFGKAATLQIFSAEELSILIGIVVSSLILTPGLFALADRIKDFSKFIPSPPWLKTNKRDDSFGEEELLDATGEHIVVAGFGPVGQAVCAYLESSAIPFTVVELNQQTVQEGKANGINIVFGDITTEPVQRAVHMEGARAFISSLPDREASLKAARLARDLQPDIEIVLRALTIHDEKAISINNLNYHIVTDESASSEIMAKSLSQICFDV